MKVALIKFLKSAQKYGIGDFIDKRNCEGWMRNHSDLFDWN
jgi:hypothetical protein